MYVWKNEKIGIRKQHEASKTLGVTSQYLSRICGKKCTIRKLLAYCITKYIDSEAEICDYFDIVQKEVK